MIIFFSAQTYVLHWKGNLGNVASPEESYSVGLGSTSCSFDSNSLTFSETPPA